MLEVKKIQEHAKNTFLGCFKVDHIRLVSKDIVGLIKVLIFFI